MENTSEVKFPDVEVQLTGQDGNIFMIMGLVAQALKRAGHRDAVTPFTHDIMASDSYTDALARVRHWVEVS